MVSSNNAEIVSTARSMAWWGRDCYCVGQQNLLSCGVCGKRFSKWIKKYDGIVIECGPNKVLSGLAKANGIENVYSTSSEDFFDKIKEEL